MQEISEYEQQANNFLKETNTKLDIKYNRFAAMPWDKDGVNRNIFDVELSNPEGSYSFEFGNSIINSCKPTAKIHSIEKCDIGVAWRVGETYISFKFESCYADLKQVYDGDIRPEKIIPIDRLKSDLERQLVHVIKLQQKSSYSKAKHILESIDRRLRNSFSWEKVLGELKIKVAAKINEALKETELIDQAEEITEPNSYDILSGLYIMESDDFADFCEQFGMELNNAEDIRAAQKSHAGVEEQNAAINEMFTEEQQELLSEIA